MAIPPKTVIEVFVRDGYKCQYCNSPPQPPEQHSLHCHHTIPTSTKHHNYEEFLNTACWKCHNTHGKILQIDRKWLEGEDVYKYNRIIAPNYKLYWRNGEIEHITSRKLVMIIKNPFINLKTIAFFERI